MAYTCNTCGIPFKKYLSLYRHMRRVHGKILKKKTQNKLEQKFELLLISLKVPYRKQVMIKDGPGRFSKYRIYDFLLSSKGILIEIDGDYWHCNPKKYPNGPINKIQKKNIQNDKEKDIVAKLKGYKLVRIWEGDIERDILGVQKKIKKLL